MARGMDTGSLIKYAALGLGGYWIYSKVTAGGGFNLSNLFGGTPAAAAPPPPSTTSAPAASGTNTAPPAATPPSSTTPAPAAGAAGPNTAGLAADLKKAVASDAFFTQQGGKGTAHQWNYYRNQLRPPELTGDQFNRAFPGDASNQQITAEEFVSKLQGAGLGAVYLPVPVWFNGGRRPVLVFTRARGSN
jgi:hypothetical protein